MCVGMCALIFIVCIASTKHPSQYFYCFTTLAIAPVRSNSADLKHGHKSGELRDKNPVPVLAVQSVLGKVSNAGP